MEHYITLFDSLFLPQGLALHMSMERHAGAYTLWVLCMDEKAHDVLEKLSLPNVRLLRVGELETEELKRVKPGRSKGEYCWTLTPFTPRFVFEADASASRVTYIDADIWFRKSPAALFAELEHSGKHVLITDHAYAPEHDQSATSGQYCVQFMTFTRNGGEAVRKWWEERCVEWCFNRTEDGKFGDQKYLDDWPERFPDQVHVLHDCELAMAPWNAERFPYGRAVIWHFHGLRLIVKDQSLQASFGPYHLPQVVWSYIYKPYLADLRRAIDLIRSCGETARSQTSVTFISRLRHAAYTLRQHGRGLLMMLSGVVKF
ncbi:MAG: hypothetical protein ACTHJ1_13155 [Bordetella sp.]|uniref:hypothetical protein n=1 Tax=Bordetella sp. TaxID=28081 RepID=UPI003F7C3723